MHSATPKLATATTAMLALDIDGTILQTGHRVPNVTIHAARDFLTAGHHLVLATGRSPAGALDVVRQLGLREGFVVLSGGASIARIETTPLTRRPRLVVEEQVRFDPAPVLLRALGAAPDALLAVEDIGRGGWLVSQKFPRGRLNGRQRRARWEHDLWNTPTTRAVVHATDADGLVHELSCCGATVTPADPDWLDLTAKGASKGAALERVRLTLGVEREATVAVGDSLNDLSAFEWAATAVAMGQSGERVQAAADVVTGPIDRNGAVEVLRDLAATL
ncbi:Cof-type HAD-IIB family hydrolase [Myceligenerans cantabricum]